MVFRIACYARAVSNIFSPFRTSQNTAQKTTNLIFIPGGQLFYSKKATVNKKWSHPFDTLPWNRTRDRPPRFRRRPPWNIDTPFYKKLLWLLRNGSRPPARPLPFRPDGYVRVEQLIGHLDKGVTAEDIIAAVKVNTLWIRVMDGHRIPGIDSSTRRIGPSEGITTAYYKSTLKQWEVIRGSFVSPLVSRRT
ncbi:hypothetical protein BDQ17DRAFT_806504 [Cyathus striatus]|nr:hypothetical protein BDQ17DRAFT_806504 [Cyathus striatus]